MRRKPTRQKPVFVHLGNVGDSHRAHKTQSYAARFKNMKFIGIDILPLKSRKSNWRQIEAEFKEGLDQLPDNAVSVISSEAAFGYYIPEHVERFTESYLESHRARELQYNTETLQTAYRKLRPGGKLMFAVEKTVWDKKLKPAFEHTPFKQENITVRPFTKKEYERTTSTREAAGHRFPLVQVIVKK